MRFFFAFAALLLMVTIAGQGRTHAAEGQPGHREAAASDNGSARMTGSLRIVALGDSITNGVRLAGVKEDETFREIARRELTAKLGRPVEVINAGVNGDIVTLALKRLQADVLDRRPSVLLRRESYVTAALAGATAG